MKTTKTNKEYSDSFESPTGKESIFFKVSKCLDPDPLKPSLVLYIVHGAVEYHGRHQLLPHYLINSEKFNLSIVWMDFKGHGLSTGSRSHVDNFDDFCLDFIELINRDLGLVGEKILLGHSMGGLVVLRILISLLDRIQGKLSGAILSNPALRTKISSSALEDFIKKDLWVPKKMRLPRLVSGGDLTRDRLLTQQFHADGLVSHFLTFGLIQEIGKAMKETRQNAYYVETPCLFLLGGEDKIVDVEETKLFLKGMNPHLLTSHLYPHGHHELFNDLDRDKVFKDVETWLIKHHSPSSLPTASL